RHTRFSRDWSSDVCSSDLRKTGGLARVVILTHPASRQRDSNSSSNRRPRPEPLYRAAAAHSLRWPTFVCSLPSLLVATAQPATRSEERRGGKGGRTRVATW